MPFESESFPDSLPKVLLHLSKAKPVFSDFAGLLDIAPTLFTINEKGIFIVVASEFLHKLYANYYLTLRKLIIGLDLVSKKPRAKPEVAKTRRRIKHRALGKNHDLEDIVNESLSSNASNIERARLNQEARIAELQKSQNQDISNKAKSENSSDHSSKDHKDIAFKNDLNKISEQMRIGEETYASYPDQHTGFEVIDNSSQSSSSMGIINNLSEKMKIFSAQRPQAQGTHRKHPKVPKDTITKKKNPKIIDQNTTFEATRASIEINDSKISFQMIEAVDLYQNFQDQLTELNQHLHISSHKDEELKHFSAKIGKAIDTEHMMPMPDYTMSRPMPDYAQAVFEDVPPQRTDITVVGKISLDELAVESGRRKQQLFYQMLWRCQRGELQLIQQQKESFGKIWVSA